MEVQADVVRNCGRVVDTREVVFKVPGAGKSVDAVEF